MRAAQFTHFGDHGVIRVVEVATPVPARGSSEVLVRVATTSVNSVDVAHREGRLRMLAGRRFPQGLGIDLVGTVEALGSRARGFEVGERVWGIRAGASGMKSATGLAASFALVDGRRLAAAPNSLDDAEAAALVTGGYTALRALKDVARVRPGERVLIRGGSGGVGSAAVSIAAALGARVAALASSSSEVFVRGLGATEFFDYASATPAAVGPVDVLLDTVGSDLFAWRRSLAPGGRMVGVAFDSPAGVATIAASTVFGARRIRTFAGEPPPGALAALTRFVEAHHIPAPVHATHSLDDIASAHRAFASGGLRGKLVLTVAT